MFSQSLFAQLLRWLLLLLVTLIALPQCQPLVDAFAQHAISGGCHLQDSPHQHNKHQHMEHHQ